MYGGSFDDIGEDPATVTWRLLRGLRHQPPGAASASESRRATFESALEQSEQLFRAARTVGPAARPPPAFYGLSQAGRAVASAAHSLPDDGFKLIGHGITCPGLRQGTESLEHLADVTVSDQRQGVAFVRLASVLESGSLPEPVRLGDLWGLLPDLQQPPLPGAGSLRAISARWGTAQEQIELRDFPAGLGTTAALVNELPSQFTTLQGWGAPSSGTPAAIHQSGNWFSPTTSVWLERAAGPGEPTSRRRPTLDGYGDQHLVLPRVGAADVSMHPFLVWWALLYSLSMLARYEPEFWASRIAIDRSAAALPIEILVDRALAMGPVLAHQAIMQASTPAVWPSTGC